MASIKAVSLDCAGTLLHISWNPGRFAVEVAQDLGLALDVADARGRYGRLLSSRWESYRDINLSRSRSAVDQFWHDLTHDWALEVGIPGESVGLLLEQADDRLFGPDQDQFHPYPDVMPALQELSSMGIRLCVLSNWDITLHRALSATNLDGYFEFAIASLEEGVEKPDPRIFQIMLQRFALPPGQVLHVGDDLLDDYRGAKVCGIPALHLDRRTSSSDGYRLARLTDLPEILSSTD